MIESMMSHVLLGTLAAAAGGWFLFTPLRGLFSSKDRPVAPCTCLATQEARHDADAGSGDLPPRDPRV